MNIALCPSPKKTEAIAYGKKISDFLKKHGVNAYIDRDFRNALPLPLIETAPHIDIFMTLGGDGTLLAYKNKYLNHENATFVGVNLGSLGFMADVRNSDYEPYLLDLINKKYTVEERLILKATSPTGELYHAVNDFVIHRGSLKNMIRLNVHINQEYFNTYHADGVIIATPTGSTAYSLAASGPILQPTLKAFVMTPIAAHNLTSRPFVADSSNTIAIEYISDHDPIDVTVDGLHSFPLAKNQSLTVSLSDKTFRLAVFTEKHTFSSTLRSKLFWGAPPHHTTL